MLNEGDNAPDVLVQVADEATMKLFDAAKRHAEQVLAAAQALI